LAEIRVDPPGCGNPRSLDLDFPLAREIRSIHCSLAFINGNQDPKNDYLSDGVTESMIDTLSQLPDLRVIARGTVFTYKGKEIDPRKVGRDLNVEAVVTGRILQKGDNLVISADLVKVSDGTQLWGKQFTRSASDLLIVQSEISREISDRLRLHLTREEQKAVSKHYTENTEAYQLFLRGRYHWYKDTPEDYDKAFEYYQKAIEKDPSYALAHIALAHYYGTLGMHGMELPKETWIKSHSMMNRARQLDPNLVEVYGGDSDFQCFYEWNWAGAERSMKQGIQLNPGNTELRRFYAEFLRGMGRWEEAIAEAKQAQELDPLTLSTNKSLGVAYFWAKQYDKALDQFQKTEELDPNFAEIHDALADGYARKGMQKEAISETEKYLRLSGDTEGAVQLVRDYQKSGYQPAIESLYERQLEFLSMNYQQAYISPMSFVFTYVHLNRKEEAFQWLEKAYQERSSWLVFSQDGSAIRCSAIRSKVHCVDEKGWTSNLISDFRF
jgi:TolB-like protein/Tfp pilus assembly protein PilF